MPCVSSFAGNAAVTGDPIWEVNFVQILKIGDRGAEVALLQTGLDRAGYGPLRRDGIFGSATRRAT